MNFEEQFEWETHYDKDLKEAFQFLKGNKRLGLLENLTFEDFKKEVYRVFSSRRKLSE